jgi:hypothetical protein
MTDPESSTEATTPPKKAADPRRTMMIVVAVLVFAIFFWLYASKLMGVSAAKREGMRGGGVALAAASLPLLDLKSKNLLGDAETLQRVVDQVVESQRYSFAAILDNNGKVVAASDRNVTAGSDYPDFVAGEFVERGVDGKYEIIQPIRQNTASYGAVVLREP